MAGWSPAEISAVVDSGTWQHTRCSLLTMGSGTSLLTVLIGVSILLQVSYVCCKVIPSRDDEDVPKFSPVSILPEIEEEEFLENSRRLDQDGAHVLHLRREPDGIKSRRARTPEGSEAVQFPDGVQAEPPQTPDPPVAASAAGMAPASASEPEAAAAQPAAEVLQEPAKHSSADAAASHVAGGSLRAGASGGGLPFSGLVPQGLPSLPGLPLGGDGNAAAIQQNVPTLFLGSFQLMRMPMPSMSDLVSMMQAGTSLFQGTPNLFQGTPNLFQGLPSLPGLPGGGGGGAGGGGSK